MLLFENTAALRFQPTFRPSASTAKPKAKAPMKPIGAATTAVKTTTETSVATTTTKSTNTTTATPIEPARPVVKTTLNDWAHTGNSDDDVNGFYASKEKERDRRRKKRRKNKEAEFEPVDWDDIYDPARPNNYEEYRDGDEKIREMEEWRDRLYGNKYGRDGGRSDEGDSEDDYRPSLNSELLGLLLIYNIILKLVGQFAPPSFNFAPPPPPPVEVPDDATGEDAYARRVRLSQMGTQYPPPPPPPHSDSPQPPLPVPPSVPHAPAPQADKIPAPTISRAPVLYQQPPTNPSEHTTSEQEEREPSEGPAYPEDEPRSLRPGQQGFAHRLLAKYGWTKGSGLGAEGTGIVKPLQVVASKKKDEVGRGKIIDQNKKKKDGDEGKFGKMTEVVVLRGMLRGINKEEIASGELRQEIGEECGEKYGRVERVYIYDMGDDDDDAEGPKVFVQFTSPLSALRVSNFCPPYAITGADKDG